MNRHLPTRLLTVFVVVLALFVAACSPGADSTTSSSAATTTDGGTQDSTTTTAVDGQESTTTTSTATSDVTISVPGTASDSIDPDVVDEMRSELAALMVEAEQVRGIPFIATPTVIILDEAEFSQRVSDLVAEDLDQEELATDSALLRDARDARTRHRSCTNSSSISTPNRSLGFYDGDSGRDGGSRRSGRVHRASEDHRPARVGARAHRSALRLQRRVRGARRRGER